MNVWVKRNVKYAREGGAGGERRRRREGRGRREKRVEVESVRER